MTVTPKTGTDEPEFNLEDELMREFEAAEAEHLLLGKVAGAALVRGATINNSDDLAAAIASADAEMTAEVEASVLVRGADIHPTEDLMAEMKGLFAPSPQERKMMAELEAMPPNKLEELYSHTANILRNLPKIRLINQLSQGIVLKRREQGRIAPGRRDLVNARMFDLLHECVPRLEAIKAGGQPMERMIFNLEYPDITRDELQAIMDSNDMLAEWQADYGISELRLTEDGLSRKVLTLIWPEKAADE